MVKRKKNKDNSSLLLNLKRTWKYVKQSNYKLIIFVILCLADAVIGAILPIFSAKIILNITNGVVSQLFLSAMTVLGLDIVSYIVNYFDFRLYRLINQKTLISMQEDLAKEILNIKVKEIDKNTSGLFIDRLNRDTEEIADVFVNYISAISNVISNIGVLLAVFILNKAIFVYSVITSICLFFIDKKGVNKQNEIFKNVRKLREKKTGLISEVVRGMRDVKVLNANDTMLKQMSDKIEETTKEQIHALNTGTFYNYIRRNLNSLFDFIYIILCCYLMDKSLITIPALIIAYNYQYKIKNLLNSFVRVIEINKSFELAANRVYEIIYDNKFEKEKFGKKNIKKLTGNIIFNDVCFSYDDIPILKKMNFEIKANERVAFVGKSGAGKTTIFNLITKLYDINDGEILLDGTNINNLSRSAIRDNMSIITQSPYIFNFSIKDNLLLAKKNATIDEIKVACKAACIDDYIESLPDGYDTIVGENGVILSGGQKQRIAIARALLMKTEIILFDEATSALDNETQSKIQEAIDNLKGKYTILIVAHRLSTVIDSDKIFVVDDGKIIASGTHSELLESCSLYKKLYSKDLV